MGGKEITAHSGTDGLGRKTFDELKLGSGCVSRQFSYHAGVITDEHRTNDKVKSAATTQLVSQITYSDGRTISYEYDAEERITKVIDSVDGTTEYTYDALGQLLTETVNGELENTMTYDNYGNIRTRNGVSYTYGNSSWKDLLTRYDGKSITYDAQGNPKSYLGHILTWEKGRQLKKFVKSGGTTVTYAYNANGIRTNKTVGSVEHTYILDGTKILRETWGSSTLIPMYDNEDSVCGIIYNDVPFYFQKNLQGDVIAIFNQDAEVVARYKYDAWGVCEVKSDTSGCGIADINPYRYRSYYYDAEIGFYYVSSRYYSAEIGRFLNSDDTIFLAFGGGKMDKNLFNYCDNNPVNNKDVSGYIAANIVGAAIGAVIGVVGGVFLGNWLADVLKLSGWKRGIFVATVAALVGAAVGAIGYFIGPYVTKISTKLGQYIAKLISKGKIALKELSSGMRSSMKSLLKQTCCFVAGTKVLTEYGHIAIEEIRTGDLVWAENPVTGEKDLKSVVRTVRRKTDTLVCISTEKEKIATTKEHPFWVVGKGWIVADRLSKGDILSLQNGTTTKVISTTVEYLIEPVYVYNFEVQDWHTYYVSDSDILVHNANCVQKFARKSASQIEKMLGVKSGTFHRIIKPDILKSVGKDILKKVGSNPDILIAQDGTIQLVSTVKKGVSVILDLNIFDFIP